jgi:transcriptional regulator with XRE-family HTH domain
MRRADDVSSAPREEDVYAFVGQQIVQLRKSWSGKGISQAELARHIDVPTSRICRWETGVYRSSLDDMLSLARFFGVPVTRFFPSEDSSPQIVRLFAAIHGMDSTTLEEIIRYANYRRAIESNK